MEIFELSADDLISAKKTVKSGTSGYRVVRAMTLLLRHKGQTRADVADTLDVTPRTVTNTCSNYARFGLDRAINDDPRPGQPIIHGSKVKAKIVAIVCSDPPEAFDRWTLELIREESIKSGLVDSISKEQVRIILKEHDLKPWQQKMWCIPELTEEYIDRMEKILDLYDTPDSPESPLICLDEKPVVLHEDSREPYIIEKGSPKKVDYEYLRNGSCNVFFAIEPYSGRYVAKVTKRRTGEDFAIFLKEISKKYSNAKKINLVMDNLNIHSIKSLERAFGETEALEIWERFDIYYTPKHGSWLNQAEIGIGMYSRQCLGKTRIATIENLRKKTRAWEAYINEKKVKINWAFSKIDARKKMGYG